MALSKGLKKAHNIGKAEAKILFLTSAYILISSLLLATLTYIVITRERDIKIFGNYFLCQSIGLQPGRQCGEISAGVQSTALRSLLRVAIILEVLVPMVGLVFVAKKCNCHYKFRK